ncbi:hypothetical protein M0811_01559 [Anaeramoeba ignava]|uniref:BTB domain-containing protein n=1 Tax=Anaeramoeba ignava TaxID=1746090 RepID=A0A9Q0LHJ9_ANAIG|nr:hypothetical protein M0811_01559 [Anaeramoeba ignava]
MNRKIIKISIIGSGGSGRRSLPVRYVGDVFDGHAFRYFEGEDFLMKQTQVDEQNLFLEIYFYGDLAPYNPYYNFTHEKEMFEQTNIFIIVISILDKNEVFSDIKEFLEKMRTFRKIDLDPTSVVLVANKIDLEYERKLSTQEIQQFANENNILFIEASAKSRKKFLNKFFTKKQKEKPPEPKLPELFPKPTLDLIPSSYQQDLFQMLNDDTFSDVKFLVISNQKQVESIFAHKIILYSRNEVFKDLFDKFSSGLFDSEEFSQKYFLQIEKEEKEEKEKSFEVTINVNYPFMAFYSMIKYIYCGLIDEKVMENQDLVLEILSISDLFRVERLNLIMKKIIQQNQENDNHLIKDHKIQGLFKLEADFLSNSFAKLMRFGTFSDFSIVGCEGNQRESLKVHLAILSQRCDYFKSLSQHEMKEKIKREVVFEDIGMESLLMIVEYIYADRFLPPNIDLAIKENNQNFICKSNRTMLELLILTDYFQIQRLKILVQINLSQTLSHEMIVQALHISKRTNCDFLQKFCYWEMGRNFQKFSKRKDFKKLSQEDKDEVIRLRFPPKEYDEYQKKYGNKK